MLFTEPFFEILQLPAFWYHLLMVPNIYEYFAAFLKTAKHAQWSQEQIDAVFEDACNGDYDHAASTLLAARDEAAGTL